jgi:hypothetical protein
MSSAWSEVAIERAAGEKYSERTHRDLPQRSVVAIELLEHLERTHSDGELGVFFKQLRADVTADRDVTFD